MDEGRSKVKDNLQIFDELFPNLDLAECLTLHENKTVQYVIDIIMQNINSFERKDQPDNNEEIYLTDLDKTLDFDEIANDLNVNANTTNTNDENVAVTFECIVCFSEFPEICGFDCIYVPSDLNPNSNTISEKQQEGRVQHILLWPCRVTTRIILLCKNAFFGALAFFSSKKSKVEIAKPTHTFCLDCIRAHALQSVTEGLISPTAYGIRCMAPACEKTILFAAIEPYLPRTTRYRLSTRLDTESIANIRDNMQNLEHCKHCYFAMEMEIPTSTNKVFRCLRCNYAYCRICGIEWDEKHFGKRCLEFDSVLKTKHEYESALNEAVVRVCPKCKLQFIKSFNCNRMQCRCGLTMCYICRKTGIKYDHFCGCLRMPGQQECKRCDKACTLWGDFKKIDQEKVEQVKSEYEDKLAKANKAQQKNSRTNSK